MTWSPFTPPNNPRRLPINQSPLRIVSLLERVAVPKLASSWTKEDLNNALVLAARNGDLVTAEIVLERGADANTKDDDTTVLMLAAENGSPQMVKALIDAGAALDAVDDQGWNAIMHANDVENLRVLLNAGASMTIKNENGETALAMAIKYDQTEIVQLLKSRGAPE